MFFKVNMLQPIRLGAFSFTYSGRELLELVEWGFYGPDVLPVFQPSLSQHWKKQKAVTLASFCFWSTLLSRHDKVGLKCPCVRTYVCPSTIRFFDFNEIIWRVGRSRWVMHDGMHYDSIQGQGCGHQPFKVGNPIFKSYLLCHLQWELATNHWFLN